MSLLGGGSNAGSLFVPNGNGLSLHIDAETLDAGEEDERRQEEVKQAEQLRQLICEELNDDLLSDDDDDDDDDVGGGGSDGECGMPLGSGHFDPDPRSPAGGGYPNHYGGGDAVNVYDHAYDRDDVNHRNYAPTYEDSRGDVGRHQAFQDHNLNDVQMKNNNEYYDHNPESVDHFGQRVAESNQQYQAVGHDQNHYSPTMGVGGLEENPAEVRHVAQLQILYKARGRKLEEITNDLHILRDDSSREIRMLKHQLNLASEENSHLKTSIDRLESESESSQRQVSQFTSDVSDLQSRLDLCEASRSDTIGRLQAREEEIHDLRLQLDDLSRSETLSRAKREHEEIVASLAGKHDAEVAALRRNVEKLHEQVNEKAITSQRLQAELDAVTRSHEKALMERAETINRLNRGLEASQNQCRDLLENGSIAEIGSLKAELNATRLEREENDRLCTSLRTEVTDLKEQLEIVQSASRLGVSLGDGTTTCGGDNVPVTDAQATVRKNLNFDTPNLDTAKSVKFASMAPIAVTEQNAALKAELERALKTIKAKRATIDQLQREASTKDELLKSQNEKMVELTEERRRKSESSSTADSGPPDGTLEDRFLTDREKSLTRRLEAVEAEREEWKTTIDDYKRRIEELITSEEQLMTLNQELTVKLNVKDDECEEREAKAAEEAREACIAFYENSKGEFVRQLETDLGEREEVWEKERTSLKDQLAEALADLKEARQNYVTLSKDAREATEEERKMWEEEKEKEIRKIQDELKEKMENLIEEKDEALKEAEEKWRQVLEEELRSHRAEAEQRLEEVSAALEDAKRKLEEQQKEVPEAADSLETLQREEERARYEEEATILRQRVEELEAVNERLKAAATESNESKQDIQQHQQHQLRQQQQQQVAQLKTEIRTLTEALKGVKTETEKEKNNAINAEKIRQETRYQLKVREMSRLNDEASKKLGRVEEELSKKLDEMKTASDAAAAAAAATAKFEEEKEEWEKALREQEAANAKLTEEKNALMAQVESLNEKCRQSESSADVTEEKLAMVQQQQQQQQQLAIEEKLFRVEEELRRKSLKLKRVDGMVEEQLKSLRLDLEQDFQRNLGAVTAEREKMAKSLRGKDEELFAVRDELAKWRRASELIDRKFQTMIGEYERHVRDMKAEVTSKTREIEDLTKRCENYDQLVHEHEENLKKTAALEISAAKHEKELEGLKNKLDSLRKSHETRMAKVKSKVEASSVPASSVSGSSVPASSVPATSVPASSLDNVDKVVEEKVAKIGRDLADHYVTALNKVKTDVLDYVGKLKRHHAKSTEMALVRERRRIGKTLKKYYLCGIENICNNNNGQSVGPNENGVESVAGSVQSRLEKLLHSGFDSLLADDPEDLPRIDDLVSNHDHVDVVGIERLISEKINKMAPSRPLSADRDDADDDVESRPASSIKKAAVSKDGGSHLLPVSRGVSQTEMIRSASLSRLNDFNGSARSLLSSPVPPSVRGSSEKSPRVIEDQHISLTRTPSPSFDAAVKVHRSRKVNYPYDEPSLPDVTPSRGSNDAISCRADSVSFASPVDASFPSNDRRGNQWRTPVKLRNDNSPGVPVVESRTPVLNKGAKKQATFSSKVRTHGNPHKSITSASEYDTSASLISNGTCYFELPTHHG